MPVPKKPASRKPVKKRNRKPDSPDIRTRFQPGNQASLGSEDSGRPTDYRPEYCDIARKMCELGAITRELADALNVSVQTLYQWGNRYPEFSESMRLGREAADNRVERSFYQRAIGYNFKTTKRVTRTEDGGMLAETEVHLPGDVTAQAKWLGARRPRQWGELLLAEDGSQRQERSLAEIKERVIGMLLQWGLKVVPADAPSPMIELSQDTPPDASTAPAPSPTPSIKPNGKDQE